jgi:hypothetical protein
VPLGRGGEQHEWEKKRFQRPGAVNREPGVNVLGEARERMVERRCEVVDRQPGCLHEVSELLRRIAFSDVRPSPVRDLCRDRAVDRRQIVALRLRGNMGQETSAAGDMTRQPVESCVVVRDVLEHVNADDTVERIAKVRIPDCACADLEVRVPARTQSSLLPDAWIRLDRRNLRLWEQLRRLSCEACVAAAGVKERSGSRWTGEFRKHMSCADASADGEQWSLPHALRFHSSGT